MSSGILDYHHNGNGGSDVFAARDRTPVGRALEPPQHLDQTWSSTQNTWHFPEAVCINNFDTTFHHCLCCSWRALYSELVVSLPSVRELSFLRTRIDLGLSFDSASDTLHPHVEGPNRTVWGIFCRRHYLCWRLRWDKIYKPFCLSYQTK